MKPRPRWFGLLKLRVWLTDTLRVSELHETLFWAGMAGLLGGAVSVLYRQMIAWVHYGLTGRWSGVVESFLELPLWQRAVTPIAGGLLAGIVLQLGSRFAKSRHTTDYMEAVVVGDGLIAVRSSLIKSASALFSIAGGGSIGREGPMGQLSAMLASLVGRFRRWSPPRRRLICACGGAAGIASAYNAPIAGALFVGEIVLGTMTMQTFGPLVFASVVATITVRAFLGPDPLYDIPPFTANSAWEIFPCLLLGALAGVVAPWFLRALRGSERLFARLEIPIFLKLALGGAVVGGLAVFYPQVCGNGYTMVSAILAGEWIWPSIVLILVFKVVATAATFGSGAVGGVFTPTLFVGACLGYLFGEAVGAIWPEPFLSSSAFAVLGMGAFLAATTHAPIMAIIMSFELTLDYQLILPLMLGCVLAYYLSRSLEPQPIYREALERKGADVLMTPLADVRVREILHSNPPTVKLASRFPEIAQAFLTHNFKYIYVVGEDRTLLGAVPLHEIKPHLTAPELADLVIAGDILRKDFPAVTADAPLTEALMKFTNHDGERLPVIADDQTRTLIGSISKRDLLLALASPEKVR